MEDQNEVKKYHTGRYICSTDALWRIHEFPLHEKSPKVEFLALHLEGEEQMMFEDPETGYRRAAEGPPVTTLTAYFQALRDFEDARDILYCDMPQYFVFVPDAQNRKYWKPRERGDRNEPRDEHGRIRKLVIGRMPGISTAAVQRELLSLRTLLLHRPAQSFEDLRTIEGVIYATFQEAALAMGIADNDNEQVNPYST